MEDGKVFTITASDNLAESVYIQNAQLNGRAYDKSWIDHHDIQKGGTLKFKMSDQPNKNFATQKSAVPFSLSTIKQKN